MRRGIVRYAEDEFLELSFAVEVAKCTGTIQQEYDNDQVLGHMAGAEGGNVENYSKLGLLQLLYLEGFDCVHDPPALEFGGPKQIPFDALSNSKLYLV